MCAATGVRGHRVNEAVSLRDYIDRRFGDHREHVDQRFDDLTVQVRSVARHRHRDLVSWRGLIIVLISVGGAVAGYLVL